MNKKDLVMSWWQAIKIVSKQPADLTKGQELLVGLIALLALFLCAINQH